jgi:thiamine biosynthesis lipoprotein
MRELSQVMERIGTDHVELSPQDCTVRFGRSGMEINLGSIGKGYALDRAAELLLAMGVENFLLHGGNSSVLGRGGQESPVRESGVSGQESGVERDESGRAQREAWWIGLRHPLAPARRIGEVRIRDRALGTSGSGTQFFVHQGKRYGHILDPRTGWPASGTLSTTVAAETGAEADALATAFYVMGRDAAIGYCRRHPSVSAVIMSPGPSASSVELVLWNIAGDEIQIYSDETIALEWLNS